MWDADGEAVPRMEEEVTPNLISQKEFIQPFCKCRFQRNSVNLSFISVMIKDTDGEAVPRMEGEVTLNLPTPILIQKCFSNETFWQ